MFCPDCGTENSRGQKFCTRCGTNLIAIDRARDIVYEATASPSSPGISPTPILVLVGLICAVGFIATTIGVVELMKIDNARTPIPVIFGIGGFGALVFICKYLLNFLNQSARSGSKKSSIPASYAPPPAVQRATNRALNEPSPTHNSVVEEPTQHFEEGRRGK